MTLTAALLAVALLSLVVPQRTLTPADELAAWHAAHPLFGGVVSGLQLDRVLTSWWVLALTAVFVTSVTIATWRMARAAARRLGPRAVPAGASGTDALGSLDEVEARAVALGYRRAATARGALVLRKHALGVWASSMLHVGIVLVVVAAALVSGFAARGAIDLSKGETFEPGSAWGAVERGPLAPEPRLSSAVRLDDVGTQHWDNGQLRSLEASVSVRGASGAWVPAAISVNGPGSIDGMTVYVSADRFGQAAFLVIGRRGANAPERRVRVAFNDPGQLPGQSFKYLSLEGTSAVFEGRAIYSADGGARLTLRLMDGKRVVAQADVPEGRPIALGPYDVTLAFWAPWAVLDFVGRTGVWLLFFAFGVICAGAMMLYLWIPREVVAWEHDGTVRVRWRAERFRQSYEDECRRIVGGVKEDL